MPGPLIGDTLLDLCRAIEELGHPRRLILSKEDFFHFFQAVQPSHRTYDQEEGPFITVMATRVTLADWPKEWPDCIDLSTASEVSKVLHPEKPKSTGVDLTEPATMNKIQQWATRLAEAKAGLPDTRLGTGEVAMQAVVDYLARPKR